MKGNDSHYIRVSEKRLQEEYEKAMNHLTVNEENRLKQKLDYKTQVEKSKLDALTAKIEKLENKYNKLKR